MNFFVYTGLDFESLCELIPTNVREKKDDLACPLIRNLLFEYVLAHSGCLMRCCPMAESLFIFELAFLHRRGGYSLVTMFCALMLVGTCFILSASLCIVCSMY